MSICLNISNTMTYIYFGTIEFNSYVKAHPHPLWIHPFLLDFSLYITLLKRCTFSGDFFLKEDNALYTPMYKFNPNGGPSGDHDLNKQESTLPEDVSTQVTAFLTD